MKHGYAQRLLQLLDIIEYRPVTAQDVKRFGALRMVTEGLRDEAGDVLRRPCRSSLISPFPAPSFIDTYTVQNVRRNSTVSAGRQA